MQSMNFAQRPMLCALCFSPSAFLTKLTLFQNDFTNVLHHLLIGINHI